MPFDIDADDIMADVRAATQGSDPAPAEPTATPPAPAPEPPPQAPSDGPARDDHGRFAPKSQDQTPAAPAAAVEPPKSPDQPAAQATEAQSEPIRPPASWSAEAKSLFATLPPAIQAEAAKRERDIDKALQERAQQLKSYEPLDAVIAPIRDRLALAGTDAPTYFRSLVAADDMLRGPNKLQAIAQIAQGYGIDLRALVNGQQQPQQAQQLDPFMQRLSTLEQHIAQQQQVAQQQAHQSTTAEIASFAADPKNLYFENVRPTMARLIQSGQAATLKDAYEQAVWADPTTRPLMLQQQETERKEQAEAQERQRVEQARKASGSLTGSPLPGTVGQSQSSPNASVEDDVRAAFAATRV